MQHFILVCASLANYLIKNRVSTITSEPFLLDVRLIFIPETLRELRASKIVNKESFTSYYYLRLLFKIQESSDNDKGKQNIGSWQILSTAQTQPSEVYKFSFISYSVHQGKIIRQVNLLGCVMGVW